VPNELDPNGNVWTIDALRVYLLAQMAALREMMNSQEATNKERFLNAEKNVAFALSAAEKAVSKSDDAYNKRFEQANETKSLAADLGARMATRIEVEQQIRGVLDKIEGPQGLGQRVGELASRIDKVVTIGSAQAELRGESRSQGHWTVQTAILSLGLIVSLAFSILSLFIKR